MIMALGQCGYSPALAFLREQAGLEHKATMVTIGLGCALTRLETLDGDQSRLDQVIAQILNSGKHHLIKGMMVAVGLWSLRPSAAIAERIIRFASKLASNESLFHVFVCSAAHAWTGSSVKKYLDSCVRNQRYPANEAAKMALVGKRWDCAANIL
jgi:hypothetical protein